MKPLHYVDFSQTVSETESSRARGSGMQLPAPVVAGAMLKALHGVFGQQPGCYALSLPRHQTSLFSALRVFATEREDLDRLVEAVESHPIIRDYARIGYPRRVPADYDGAWVEFRRYRIPSRKSGRKPDDSLRERRMAQAEDRRLPYFILQSRSTGQQFGLYLEVCPALAPLDCQPDSYGLSVTSRPFALPDLP